MLKVFKKTLVFDGFLYLMFNCGAVFAFDKNDAAIRMAEHAILATLVTQTSENGRYLCVKDKMACLGSNQADMGLAIIGLKNEEKFVAKLANLVRYQMDGGFAEDYSCYVLDGGSKMKKHLEKIKPKELENICLSEFKAFVKNKQFLGAVDYRQVCRDSVSIKKEIRKLVVGISRQDRCSE